MGIFDWFSALSKGEDVAHTKLSSPQLGAIQETAVIEGLDFVAAIEAHRKWRDRLSSYVSGTSTEVLDPTIICRDDQCALGKWIYGTGMTFTGHLQLFHQLKAKHAQFHISASQVVELVKHDQKDTAVNLLIDGEFAKSSRDVQSLLSKLYLEMKQKKPDTTIEEVKKNLETRDYIDSHREISPLRKAADAIELDNTNLTMDEQLNIALKIAEKLL